MNMNICKTCTIGPRCHEQFLAILEKGPLADLGVILAGISDLKGTYVMSRPNPAFCVFLGTLSGEGRFQAEAGEQILKAGDFLLAPAGRPHRYDTISGKIWRTVWFHIRPQHGFVAFKDIRVIPSDVVFKLAEEVEDILKETTVSSYLSLNARMAKETYVSIMIQRLFQQGTHGKPERYEEILYQLWRRVAGDLSRQWELKELAT